MPATAMTSCTTPASALAGAGLPTTADPFGLGFALDDSQAAVSLLKNSDDAWRLLGTCFVRVMARMILCVVGG